MTGEAEFDRATVLRGALFLFAILIFWITLEPFSDLSAPKASYEGGDLLNQILYVGLFGLTVFALFQAGWRRARPLLHPAYLAVLAWFAVTAVLGVNPGISLRRLVMSSMVMSIVGVMLVLPRDTRQFGLWLGGAALFIVVLCYLAVGLTPRLAIHQLDVSREAALAGDWRGLYDHKSTAGPMMIVFMSIGLYLIGQERRALGWILFILATIFLLFTGAKQPIALTPVVFLGAWWAVRSRARAGLLAVCLGTLFLYNVMTVGSAVIPAIGEINARLLSDPTFTNRIGIWDFAVSKLQERPVIGYGFLGFWNTDAVRQIDSLGQQAWTAEATDSHNSYLDLALTTGLPGLALGVWAIVVLPLLDFLRARDDPARRALALMFFRIWLFTVFVAALETVFFLRDGAVWVSFLLAVFGLRYLAAYGIKA